VKLAELINNSFEWMWHFRKGVGWGQTYSDPSCIFSGDQGPTPRDPRPLGPHAARRSALLSTRLVFAARFSADLSVAQAMTVPPPLVGTAFALTEIIRQNADALERSTAPQRPVISRCHGLCLP